MRTALLLTWAFLLSLISLPPSLSFIFRFFSLQEVRRIIEQGLAQMRDAPSVRFEDLFTATRADLQSFRGKTSAKSGQTAFETSVKSVIIGKVPDRGGRVNDMRAPNKGNMPEWAPRSQSGGGGHGGGHGGGGGRGTHGHSNKKQKKKQKGGGGGKQKHQNSNNK